MGQKTKTDDKMVFSPELSCMLPVVLLLFPVSLSYM